MTQQPQSTNVQPTQPSGLPEEQLKEMLETAETLAQAGKYQDACLNYLSVLKNDADEKFHQFAISQINNLRAHIHGPHLNQAETAIAQHPESLIFPMIVSEDDHGLRGMSSLTAVTKGEVVLRIPLSEMITCEMGEQTPFGQAFKAMGLEVHANDRAILLLFAALEGLGKDPNHLLNEPSYVEGSMCHFWSNETIQLLKGSHVQEEVIEFQKQLEEDYQNLCKIDGFKDACSLHLFKKLKAEIDSKNFTLELKDRKISAFVPIAHTINHQLPASVKWSFNEERMCFEEKALTDIHPGQTIWQSYGSSHANDHLLTQYGFTENPSPHDFIVLDNGVRLFRTPTSDLARQYWVEFVSVFANTCGGNRFQGELLLFSQIYDACLRKIPGYASSPEEDQQWLIDHPEKNTEYFIRQLMLSEKLLIIDWLSLAKEVLYSAQEKQENRLKLINHWQQVTEGPRLYLKHFWSDYLKDENNVIPEKPQE